MKKLTLVFLSGFFSILILSPVFAARTDHGLPGVYNVSPFTLSDGEGSALSTDSNGKILLSPSSSISLSSTTTINAIATTPAASTTLTYLFDNSSSTVNVKSSAGDYHGMFIDNATSTKLFVQLFNSSTTTISGAVPTLTYAIGGGNQMIIDASYFKFLQKYFSNGIALGISSSFATFTPSADYNSVNIMVEYD